MTTTEQRRRRYMMSPAGSDDMHREHTRWEGPEDTYYCEKCNKRHYTSSNIGYDHAEYGAMR